jgi:hypothetical protein
MVIVLARVDVALSYLRRLCNEEPNGTNVPVHIAQRGASRALGMAEKSCVFKLYPVFFGFWTTTEEALPGRYRFNVASFSKV